MKQPTLASTFLVALAAFCYSVPLPTNDALRALPQVHNRADQAWYNPKRLFRSTDADLTKDQLEELGKEVQAKIDDLSSNGKDDSKQSKKLKRLKIAIEDAVGALEKAENFNSSDAASREKMEDEVNYKLAQVTKLANKLGWKPVFKTAGKVAGVVGGAAGIGFVAHKYGDTVVRKVKGLFGKKTTQSYAKPNINKANVLLEGAKAPLNKAGVTPTSSSSGLSPLLISFVVFLILVVVGLGIYINRGSLFGTEDADEPEPDVTGRTKKRRSGKKRRKSKRKKRREDSNGSG